MIEITKKEAELLADYIAITIFDVIRDDETIDNVDWLESIVNIYRKCKTGAENEE